VEEQRLKEGMAEEMVKGTAEKMIKGTAEEMIKGTAEFYFGEIRKDFDGEMDWRPLVSGFVAISCILLASI
jgi:hypothetical protein